LNSPSPSWSREIGAIFRKELTSELRSKSGLMTAGLFGLVTVVAIALSANWMKMGGTLAAGLLWVALLFSASIALPRTFLIEEEQRTGDLLRLWARPHSVFWGKCLYNLAQMIATGFVLSFLFFALTHRQVNVPLLYVVSLIGGCASLAGAVTLCGALVAQAANRSAMAAAVAVPMLLPLVALGVSAMRVALGDGLMATGTQAAVGLIGYAAVTLALGPALFAAVWKS
jgi:heme exporter protein B